MSEASASLPAETDSGGDSGARAGAEIAFERVTKRYVAQHAPAVKDLTLVVPAGEICVLVGPSGGGKTTAMKLVNRLIELDEGDITIDGRSIRSLDPVELRRGIGYVIQQVGLFPHMTVAGNIATVPRLLGWDKARASAAAWTSCSSWSASSRRATATATRRSSRAASASASAWPGRWPSTRR